jgi:hypothetical protein
MARADEVAETERSALARMHGPERGEVLLARKSAQWPQRIAHPRLYITCSRRDHFSVTLSPNVEAEVLSALTPEIGLAVADEIGSGRFREQQPRTAG